MPAVTSPTSIATPIRFCATLAVRSLASLRLPLECSPVAPHCWKDLAPTYLNAFDNLEKDDMIPSRLEALAADAQTLGLLLTDPALVLVEDDIKHPVNLILDPPMATRRLAESLGFERRTEQVVATLGGPLLSNAPLCFDHADGLKPWPVVVRIEPGQDVLPALVNDLMGNRA